VPDWELEKQQRRAAARAQNHEGELDGAFVIREKPPTPLQHTSDRVPWRPSQPLPQRGLQYVWHFITAVAKSRRDGRPADHEDHAQGAGSLPKWTNRRHGSWLDLHKAQRHGSLCHLRREWVDTYANRPDAVTGTQKFSARERAYRLQAMQHVVANIEAHYSRLTNQPDLWEIWAFQQRLVLPPSQRGRSKVTREFTVTYPNPDLQLKGPGCGLKEHPETKTWGPGSLTWPWSMAQIRAAATWQTRGGT
jgi:hypothetical protein